jgi:hypothetical protein
LVNDWVSGRYAAVSKFHDAAREGWVRGCYDKPKTCDITCIKLDGVDRVDIGGSP